MRSWLPLPFVLATCLLPIQESSATCYNVSRATLWNQTGEPIPVYVNWNDANVGLSNLHYDDPAFDQDSMELYVKAAITQINEASTGSESPRLYFAGWIDGMTTASANRPDRSVVLHTTGCSLLCGSGIACTTTISDRFRVDLLEGGSRECGGDLAWTVHPSDDPDTPDLQGTIAHELVHVLGLGHSNDPTCEDDAGWNEPFWSNGDVQNSVMAVPLAANSTYATGWYRLRRRTLQGDDFAGLAYGTGMYDPVSSPPLFYTSTDAVNWTADQGPAGLTTRRTVALSSAGDADVDYLVAAWPDTINDIRWSVRDADGTWSAPQGCSANDTSCDTIHPPATATLGGRTDAYMVAWLAGEDDQDSYDELRYEIIDRNSGTVLADETYLWHFDHYSRVMGVGTNPDNDAFIVAALAEHNVVILHSIALDGTVTRVRAFSSYDDVKPHHIGDPVCTESLGRGQMRCVLPMTTEGVDGMCSSYLQFEHGPMGFQAYTVLHDDCDVRVSGRPAFAAGWQKEQASFLMAGAQPSIGESTDMYGIWSITDPMSAVNGSHTAVTNPGPANRFRNLGSLVDDGSTLWMAVDSYQTP